MENALERYCKRLPEPQRTALMGLGRSILKIVPDATVGISTRVPAFRYRGKYLLSVGATRTHLSLLVMQGDVIRALGEELRGYSVGRRIIRFTADAPLGPRLLRKIITLRIAQIEGGRVQAGSPSESAPEEPRKRKLLDT